MQESKRAEKQLQKNVISPSEVRLQLAELQHRQDINKTPKLPAATKKAKHVFHLAQGQFISMLASVKNSRNNCLVSSSQFSKSCSPTCEIMAMHGTTFAESLRLQRQAERFLITNRCQGPIWREKLILKNILVTF